MQRSQKMFRVIWRINAVFILFAMVGVLFLVGLALSDEFSHRSKPREDAGVPLAIEKDPNLPLRLGTTSTPVGTNVLRVELMADPKKTGLSSGYASEKRNVLFVEPGQKSARWLLPDNNSLLTELNDIDESTSSSSCGDQNKAKLLATVAFVQPAGKNEDTENGKIVLFDPPGVKIVEVAKDARRIVMSSFSEGRINVLYEHEKKLTLASYDPTTLEKQRETDVVVPQLKTGN